MVNAIVAGAASGLLMASLFICGAELMLFFLVKSPPPAVARVFERFPPAIMAIALVVVSFPVWMAIGTVLGVVFLVGEQQLPDGGLGSPNLAFTLAVIAATAALAAPLVVLMRPLRRGLLALSLTAMAVFGWFLPYFAS